MQSQAKGKYTFYDKDDDHTLLHYNTAYISNIIPYNVETLVPEIDLTDALVAPKHDGVRCKLVTCDGDMSMHVGGKIVNIGIGGEGYNVLDCEVVDNTIWLLDVYVYNGRPCYAMSFNQRYVYLCSLWFSSSTYTLNIQTFSTFNKDKPVRSREGSIFVTGVNDISRIYKHKVIPTVDFLADNEGNLKVNNNTVFATLADNRTDIAGHIIECYYLNGVWKYNKHRYDKDTPNSRHVADVTLRVSLLGFDPYSFKVKKVIPKSLFPVCIDPREAIIEAAFSLPEPTISSITAKSGFCQESVHAVMKHEGIYRATATKYVLIGGVTHEGALYTYLSCSGTPEQLVSRYMRIMNKTEGEALEFLERVLDPSKSRTTAIVSLVLAFIRHQSPIISAQALKLYTSLRVDEIVALAKSSTSFSMTCESVSFKSYAKVLDILHDPKPITMKMADIVNVCRFASDEACALIREFDRMLTVFPLIKTSYTAVRDAVGGAMVTAEAISRITQLEPPEVDAALTCLMIDDVVARDVTQPSFRYYRKDDAEFGYRDVLERVLASGPHSYATVIMMLRDLGVHVSKCDILPHLHKYKQGDLFTMARPEDKALRSIKQYLLKNPGHTSFQIFTTFAHIPLAVLVKALSRFEYKIGPRGEGRYEYCSRKFKGRDPPMHRQ
jgi:hypothetical protein